jgi:hypothetical protein
MDNEDNKPQVRVGRKSKYTPKTVQTILNYLADGNNQQDSAILSGVHKATYFEWLNLYPEFADAVKEAMAHNKATRLKRISTHARTNWQADAWYLERMFPQEFALKSITEHTGKVDNEITIRIVPDIPQGISNKQLKQIEESYINGEEVKEESKPDKVLASLIDTNRISTTDTQSSHEVSSRVEENQKDEGLSGSDHTHPMDGKPQNNHEIDNIKPLVSYKTNEE